MLCRMTGIICPYTNENGYCDSTACHNMNVVGNIIPKEHPENISNSSIWVKPQSNWHTGTPTEDGWYLVAFNYEDEEGVRYTTDYFKDGKWAFPMVRDISKVVAWQKIEESEDGK